MAGSVTNTQQNFRLRRPQPTDSAGVRAVAQVTWEATYSESVSRSNRERIISISYSDEALKRAFRVSPRSQWFWVATNQTDQIVGFAEALVRRGPGQTGDAELTRIYVLPQWQHQGVGRALVEALLADLRALRPELRPPRLYLSVAADNQRAINFYEERGFRYNRNFQANLPGQWLAMREYLIEV